MQGAFRCKLRQLLRAFQFALDLLKASYAAIQPHVISENGFAVNQIESEKSRVIKWEMRDSFAFQSYASLSDGLTREIETWQVIKKKANDAAKEASPLLKILSLARFVELSFQCQSVLGLKCATRWR